MITTSYEDWDMLMRVVGQIKKDIKAKLTLNATGASGGEGPRTHVQGK